jgi:hypothetical protein
MMPPFLEEKPDLFGLETLFGACSQTVALEDNIWDLDTISWNGGAMFSMKKLPHKLTYYI